MSGLANGVPRPRGGCLCQVEEEVWRECCQAGRAGCGRRGSNRWCSWLMEDSSGLARCHGPFNMYCNKTNHQYAYY